MAISDVIRAAGRLGGKISNPFINPILGAGIGAIYGAATNESNVPGSGFLAAGWGAILGGGIGALATKTALRTGLGALHGGAVYGAARKAGGGILSSAGFAAYDVGRTSTPRLAYGAAASVGRMGLGLAKGSIQLGAKAGMFAMRHPGATLGMVGVGAGAIALAGSGRPDSQLNREQRMQFAQQQGSSYLDQNFQASTENLVQGLHAGRHGGR